MNTTEEPALPTPNWWANLPWGKYKDQLYRIFCVFGYIVVTVVFYYAWDLVVWAAVTGWSGLNALPLQSGWWPWANALPYTGLQALLALLTLVFVRQTMGELNWWWYGNVWRILVEFLVTLAVTAAVVVVVGILASGFHWLGDATNSIIAHYWP